MSGSGNSAGSTSEATFFAPSGRVLRAQAIAAVVVTAGLVFLIDPAGRPTEMSRFLSRFHPALVHFPVGLVTLAAALGLASLRWSALRAAGIWTYMAGAWSGVLAVGAGLLLAQAGGYDNDTLFLHRLGGILLVVTAAWAPWVLHGRRRWPSAAATALTVILLLVTGHNGGTLTHGPDYMTAHAPAFLAALGSGEGPEGLRLGDPDSTTVYEAVVAPILEARCTSCHGQGRTRGGLDLNTPEGILDGGDDGPVLVAGQSTSSLLIERILLPPGDADVMPPNGGASLSPSGAQLLSWWIDQGASFEMTLAQADLSPVVGRILESSGLGAIRTGVWALDVGPADPALAEALRQQGARVQPVAEAEHFLSVRCAEREACFADGGENLVALADHVVWLDLARSSATDADVALLSRLPLLEKLWLQQTEVTDVSGLGSLEFLDYLNLSGTQVGAEAFADVAHVERIYYWGTPADSTADSP